MNMVAGNRDDEPLDSDPMFRQTQIWHECRSNLYWLVVSNMAFIFQNIWDVILPIDFHIFQDG